MDLVGPLEVLDAAGRIVAGSFTKNASYRLEVVSPDGAPFRTSSGMTVQPSRALGSIRKLHTLIVAGGRGTEAVLDDPDAMQAIARVAGRAERVASVCTGAFLLAGAGLLEGRRATTHWASCARLEERFDAVDVEPDAIFVRDGHVWTSAGVTAGMDLALALVEEDLGRDVALQVARWLVMFVKRPGGQSQFSAQLGAQLAERDSLRELQHWIAEHPDADLRVPALARRSAMSPRNFARVFREQTGLTPASYVERARVEVARRMLEQTGLELTSVADACGFGSPQRLRRAFSRRVGVSPTAYRARFRATPAKEISWTS